MKSSNTGDRIGGRQGSHRGYMVGPLGRKLEDISSPAAKKEQQKSKAGNQLESSGLKRAPRAVDALTLPSAHKPRKKSKIAEPAKATELAKSAGFAPDERLVSLDPMVHQPQASTQPAVSQQNALTLLGDARTRAERICRLPLKSARTGALSKLVSELTDRMLATVGTSQAPGWSVASRKLALMALSYGHGTLSTAAEHGDARQIADELAILAETIDNPEMLKEYRQVEMLEVVVVNVCAHALLSSGNKFAIAAEWVRTALLSLCEGSGKESRVVEEALNVLIKQWAALDADLGQLCTQSRPLITELARRIMELPQRA